MRIILKYTPAIAVFVASLLLNLPAEAQQTSFISCDVKDVETLLPIPNAKIRLDNTVAGITDSNGRFLLKEVKLGQHRVSATATGYLTSLDSVSVFEGSINMLSFRLPKAIFDYRLKNVSFDSKSAVVKPVFIGFLDSMITAMKKYPSSILQIAGNSDAWETAKNDTLLSNQRAKAVAAVLISKGIAANRISIKSYGNSRPVAPNSKAGKKYEEGCQLNRRVDFKIITYK